MVMYYILAPTKNRLLRLYSPNQRYPSKTVVKEKPPRGENLRLCHRLSILFGWKKSLRYIYLHWYLGVGQLIRTWKEEKERLGKKYGNGSFRIDTKGEYMIPRHMFIGYPLKKKRLSTWIKMTLFCWCQSVSFLCYPRAAQYINVKCAHANRGRG